MHQHSSAIQDSENQSQNTVQQQKGQHKSQTNHPKSIQAKQKTLQRKAKPPIQAKHKPVQAKQSPVQRNQGGKTTAQGSTQFKEIATTMGEQHGVDTSPLKATHNSSFPQTVNAAATIQGNKIDFAPGEDTTTNMKHEVAHYIDNTKNGTPQGDKVVNGQKIDTTREKVVDKMAEGTLQRKLAVEQEPTQANTDIIQRRVILTRDNPRKDDKVEKNSIRFSQSLVGGEFQTFTNANFSNVAENEKIAFVGHGEPGKSGNYTAKQIADKLTGAGKDNVGKGLPDGNHDIIFTSCDAGTEKIEKDDGGKDIDNGVLAYIDRAIIGKWPEAKFKMRGARGPSIKTLDNQGKEVWAVVEAGGTGMAGVLQYVLSAQHGVDLSTTTDAPDDHEGFKGQGLTSESRDEYQSAELTANKPRVQRFFLDFIQAVNGNWDEISAFGKIGLNRFVDDVEAGAYKKNGDILSAVAYIQQLQEADPVSIGRADNINEITHE
ncbi:MAG TPA: hypothetical protein DCS93_41420 [Microscillaceae bacterium]|nr:hypothetical protein [Microscillaceae bacterium]